MSTKLQKDEVIERCRKALGAGYDYSLVEYKGNSVPVRIRCLSCGKVFFQRPTHLFDGYGCRTCKNRRSFLDKAIKVHNSRYDYSSVEYKDIWTKVKIICPVHGEFWQVPEDHVKGCGCPKCGNIRMRSMKMKPAEVFLAEARKTHGSRFDYSLARYTGCFSRVKIICPRHGVFRQTPHDHLAGRGCPACSRSLGERTIELWLEDKGYARKKDYFSEHKFSDLYDKSEKDLLRYDFYIPSKNLLVEYNGEQHYKETAWFQDTRKAFLLRKHHDWLKRKYARDHGIRLLVIPFTEFSSIDKILVEALG